MDVVRTDVGLGTAWERRAIHRLVVRWSRARGVARALEGPIDGMAGIGGLHLLPLAASGTHVTVVADGDAADLVRAAYAHHGVSDRLEVVPVLPAAGAVDLVLSFGAL